MYGAPGHGTIGFSTGLGGVGVRVRIAVVLGLVFALAGCLSAGPKALEAARSNYNEVLRDTADEQLLANLVRLRYRDRPFFLEVSAVTTQFRFAPSAGVGLAAKGFRIDDDFSLSVDGGISETPTISYAPLQGEDFARRLLTPLSLEALVLLNHSGWSAERLFRLTVQRANGLRNAVTASGPTPERAPDYAEFAEFARALRALQLADGLLLGRHGTGDGALTLAVTAQGRRSPAYETMREGLGLQGTRSAFPLRAGAQAGDGSEIVLQTRSLNGVLYFLANAVEVPSAHLREGRVVRTLDDAGQPFSWNRVLDGLMQVQVADKRPKDAAVAVPYRGYWFYIDDRDGNSKATFSLLTQLFALQAGQRGDAAAPVLTIPAGS